MKRILKWLETKFSGHSAAVEADEHHTPVDEYVSDDAITQPALRTLDESLLDASESIGFDPYNSGSFETSKSRSHK